MASAQPKTMITRALQITLDAVPIAPVNNTHATSPLTQRFDTDVFGRGGRRSPVRILGGQGVPDTDRIVQTQMGIVTDVTRVQFFQSAESVSHEGIDPLCERGASLDERSDCLMELATGNVVAQGDVQGEKAQCQLPAQFGRVWWKHWALRRRQS